jgi:hypothetical protein
MHGEYISTPPEYPTVIELILLSYSGIHNQPGEDGLLHKAADAVDAMLTRGSGSIATKDWQARLHPSPDADVNAWPKDSTWRVSSLPGAREEMTAESALGAIFGAFGGR